MKLFEVFNDPSPYEWQKTPTGYTASFTTPKGQEFTINTLIPRNDPKTIYVDFVNESAKKAGKDSTGITGTGEAPSILATVLDALRAYLKKHDVEQMIFSAREPSRRKLYSAMARKLVQNDWVLEKDREKFYLIRADAIPPEPERPEPKGLLGKLMPWRY